jgi:hypothetical protein
VGCNAERFGESPKLRNNTAKSCKGESIFPTCELRENILKKNIYPMGLLGVGVGLTTQPRKKICREIRKNGQSPQKAIPMMMMMMMMMC